MTTRRVDRRSGGDPGTQQPTPNLDNISWQAPPTAPAHGGNRAERRRRGVRVADLSVGLEHHRAGRLDRAEALYRKHLRRVPGDPDALHLLGMVALSRGDTDRAIQLIERAVARVPDFAQGHSNLGNALRAAGRLDDACASYRRAIAVRPEFAAAHSNLGLALCEQGNFAAAVASCQRAIDLDPRGAEAHVNLGHALRRMGRGREAEASFRKATLLQPHSAEIRLALADALHELQRFAEAIACYRRVAELDPGRVGAHRGLAVSLRSTGDVVAAIASYRDALALNADDAALWNDLGRCYLALGRFDDAVGAFRHALALDPDLADAYRSIAACRLLSADGPEVVRLATLAERADLPDEDRATAGFALAKALDDAGRYDQAFAAYDAANSAYRAARAAAGDRFDPADLNRVVDRLIAEYSPAFFTTVRGWGNPSDVPVFIVGLPRSGTSLVEQIAASHSCVFGAGELRHIGDAAAVLGSAATTWTRAAVRDVADRHLERLHELGGQAKRIIDKLPDNIFMLGVIASLYPSARVIFCRRDPRDIGVSCFFQRFSAGLLTFSYDLADCGHRIRETERLAAHWHEVLPLRALDIEYERLVTELEGESRRLVEFLGLPWEPACLDFHRTARTVQTASSWQVRQPLYRQSVGRWQHYRRHLDPLLRALAAAPVESARAG